MFDKIFNGDLPLQATAISVRWDFLYYFLVWLSVFFSIIVIGGMLWFSVKYRSRPGLKAKFITHNNFLEVIFTIIPTVLLMGIFYWGYDVYHAMVTPPPNAMEIRVVGKQWLWQFIYPNGKVTAGDLYVPVNQPVKLIMTSDDVLHSFFVPNFRVKQDVVPGMYTSVWFEARMLGRHQIYCTEYCGTSHSGMLGKVVVLDDQQWAAWLKGKKIPEVPVAVREMAESPKVAQPQGVEVAEVKDLTTQGRHVFESRGCVACHSVDGSNRVGPTLKGLIRTEVELTDGSRVKPDDNYLRESLERPQAKIVKGFQGVVMPTFKGLVSETEMAALITYIKSLN